MSTHRTYIKVGSCSITTLANAFRNVRWSFITLAALIGCFISSSSAHAIIVFKDDFNRSNDTALGSISGPGTGTWAEIFSGTPTGDDLVISNNTLVSIHGTSPRIFEGLVPTAGFLAPWASTLAGNPGTVAWNINLQSTISEMGGAPSSSAMGIYLAATGSGFDVGNNGYFLDWGQPGSSDPLRLYRSNNGSGFVSIITASTAPFNDIGTNYLSVRVEFVPSTNTWTLLARDDGFSGFSNPATGAYVNLGSNVDSVFTNVAMNYVGVFGSYPSGTSNDQYRYDDFSIEVVPEPSGIILSIGAICSGVGVLYRRGRRR